ncbi:MAG TPA: aminotransferase class V-fold PLP-dependent enzyme [Dehalococcoidia bacterium]|nr:aminotransferase class V-fold PLP-dependent enzyme [Dehalococcoidia bacterium]
MDIYERVGVPPVINAAGKLTALGGSAQHEEVAAAQFSAARGHVDLSTLRQRAGELAAQATGAEAASITTGAAAGIVVSVAAVIAGTDPRLIALLPESEGQRNRILIQAGHWVNFGAPVEQMVRLGGGVPQLVGNVNNVPEAVLEETLRESEPAALLYVQSHHAVQERMVSLERSIELAHTHNVPVIVDAAAEQDLLHYIATGVDLVTYSGGKALGGPTVGFIAGRRELVEACEAQTRGIARPMKVGKEQIVALLVALERYSARDESAELEREQRVNAIVRGSLDGIDTVDVTLRPDEAGRPIERVALSARDGAFDVRELVDFLAEGSPSIRTRNHHLDAGIVAIDPREVSEEQAAVIADRLRAFFRS